MSFVAWFTADFILYGIANVGHVRAIVVDVFLESVPGSVAGGIVAALSGQFREHRSKMKQAA